MRHRTKIVATANARENEGFDSLSRFRYTLASRAMDQPKREIRTCRNCQKELTSWKSPFCSDDCYAAYEGPASAKPASVAIKEPDAPEPPASVTMQPEQSAKP